MLLPGSVIASSRPYLKSFKRRSCLPVERDYVWAIEDGFVRTITWLEDGTITTLGLWGPGEFVGRIFSNITPLEIQCLSSVAAKPINIQENPFDTNQLLVYLQYVEELMVIRSHLSTETRLLKLLSWLMQRYGTTEGDNNKILDLGLSHQDLAETIGTTRVTVTRLLGQLEEGGIVERLSKKRLVIHPPDTWYYQI
jgi:CRP-like cAMP-binding protein